jgi:hypothetical protein
MKRIFVFAVCGIEEHIDTLHFSLEKLKKFSNSKFIVVTDSSRNEKPILVDSLIDVKTPQEFDNHQASIYLKTGLFKFLPKGNLYCYLDSDVVSVSTECDEIFNEFIAPIRFAPDHCQVPMFSPAAVNCECRKEISNYVLQLNKLLDEADPYRNSKDENIISKRKELEETYWKIKTNYALLFQVGLKFVFSFKEFKLSQDMIYNKKTKIWRSGDGKAFKRAFNLSKITRKLGLKWSITDPVPRLKDGRSIWQMECLHLLQFIKEKFNIEVSDKNWQHWNGGVFLFSDESHSFLNTWHEMTLEIFKDPKWKTRDQGTLIATVWKLGLENHPMLDKKWNLLADYNNPNVIWLEGWKIQLSSKEIVQPNFVHVYHHFFDKNWLLWRKIEDL